MKQRTLLWLAGMAGVAVIVAAQVVSAQHSDRSSSSRAPAVRPGSDVLAGTVVVDARVRGSDYRRDAFGRAWDDDNDAPGGRNGCDTRDEILARDLSDTTYVSTKRCPGPCAAAPCAIRIPMPPSPSCAATGLAPQSRSITSFRWRSPGTWVPGLGP